MTISKVLILGGGIAGISAALALSSVALRNPKLAIEIEVFELRSEPSTLGGAVNLTPNVLRYLDDWGITRHLVTKGCEVPRIEIYALRTGKLIGSIDYDDVEKFKFRALRVSRWVLLECLLEALKETNVKVHYGKSASKISSDANGVQVDFEDGSVAKGDILLGCDGIHSFVRTSYVEPERKPIYTGVSVVSAATDSSCFTSKPPFESTGMYSGRLGSIMMSYADQDKQTIYAGAVMETSAAESKDGWRVRGADQVALRKNILERFGDSPNKFIDEFVNAVKDMSLFPVYKLPNHGKWFRERCILLGDAAHAMPPQGESVCLAVEDVVLLAALIENNPAISIEELFEREDKLRRTHVEKAYEEASMRFETVKDKGWFAGMAMEYMTGIFLTWTKAGRDKNLAMDVRSLVQSSESSA